jgi:hypothetical protein
MSANAGMEQVGGKTRAELRCNVLVVGGLIAELRDRLA